MNRLSFVLVPWVLLAFVGCASPGSPGGPTPPPGVKTDPSNREVLSALGVKLSSYPSDRLDSSGKAMKVDNPYGETVVNTTRQVEVFVASATNLFSLVNPTAVGSESLPVNADALTGALNLIKRPVAADLDGNGKQEIVTAVFAPTAKTITFYKMADGPGPYTLVATGKTVAWNPLKTYPTETRDWYGVDLSNSYFSINRDWNHSIDLSAGNLNGLDTDRRERDEIVIASEGTLFVLGPDLTLVDSLTVAPLTGAGTQILRVEVGDLDNDKRAEIVVSNGTYDSGFTAQVSLYHLSLANKLEIVDAGRGASVGNVALRTAEIAIGNVVGDPRPEVVLSGLVSGDWNTATLVVAPGRAPLTATLLGVSKTESLDSGVWNFFSGWTDPRGRDAAVPILVLADLDGNGVCEIAAGDSVLSLKQTGTSYTLEPAFGTTGDQALRRDLGAEYLPGWGGIWGNRAPDTAYYNQAQAGDLNGDGLDEIVLVDFMKNKLRVLKYNPNNLTIERAANLPLTTGQSPYLCLADVDRDGLVLEFVGHTMEFTQPLVIAAMASPPYWNRLTPAGEPIQYTGNMATTFGVTAGAGVGGGATFGVSGGVKAGAEGTIPVLGNGKAKTVHTVAVSVDVDFDVTVAAQASYDLIGSAGDNYVVFTAVPVDYYVYKVLETDGSQNAEGDPVVKGDLLTVTLPRPSALQAATVEFYNANNGKYPDVDKAVFGHTIGEPRTYLSKTEAQGLLSLNPMSYLLDNLGAGQVAAGNLLNQISYANSVSTGVTVTSKITYTNDTEVSFVGLAGYTYSVAGGLKLSVSANVGSLVAGSVGGLRTEYATADYKYAWGLCTYAQTIPGQVLPFAVITYWVN